MDAAKHKQFTGVDNTLIIDNLRKLVADLPRPSIVVRTPLIPGFNDSVDDISKIIEFLRELPSVTYEYCRTIAWVFLSTNIWAAIIRWAMPY